MTPNTTPSAAHISQRDQSTPSNPPSNPSQQVTVNTSQQVTPPGPAQPYTVDKEPQPSTSTALVPSENAAARKPVQATQPKRSKILSTPSSDETDPAQSRLDRFRHRDPGKRTPHYINSNGHEITF